MLTLFSLSHSDYEEYSPFLVVHASKTEDEFKLDAHEAMNIVANRIVDTHSTDKGWIGTRDIVKEAVKVLIEQGYEAVQPIEVTMTGSDIIDTSQDIKFELNDIVLEKIIECNSKVRERVENE